MMLSSSLQSGASLNMALEAVTKQSPAPLNQEFGDAVGADGYCRDAAITVDMAKDMIAQKRAA